MHEGSCCACKTGTCCHWILSMVRMHAHRCQSGRCSCEQWLDFCWKSSGCRRCWGRPGRAGTALLAVQLLHQVPLLLQRLLAQLPLLSSRVRKILLLQDPAQPEPTVLTLQFTPLRERSPILVDDPDASGRTSCRYLAPLTVIGSCSRQNGTKGMD